MRYKATGKGSWLSSVDARRTPVGERGVSSAARGSQWCPIWTTPSLRLALIVHDAICNWSIGITLEGQASVWLYAIRREGCSSPRSQVVAVRRAVTPGRSRQFLWSGGTTRRERSLSRIGPAGRSAHHTRE